MPRSSQRRTALACKTCRHLKVRCLPSDRGDICEKCVRSGAQCVFEDHKPRRKRETPDSRARVAVLESKFDDLIAQVSSLSNSKVLKDSNHNNQEFDDSQSGRNVTQNRSAGFPETSSVSDTMDQFLTPSSLVSSQRQSIAENTECLGARNRSLDQYYETGATPKVLVSEGVLSIADIDKYIGQFREMEPFFPFVIVPRDESINSMLRDRPFLMHAVLAVASSSETRLQKILEKSFREIIFRSLLFENQKSIDLLESILIYIGWGHFFHVPKRDRYYQLVQMVFGLCVDLGLNLSPSAALEKRLGLHLDHFQPTGDDDKDNFWSREATRAFVGCFYISSTSSWVWAKPNPIEYSDHILECAKSISDNPECSTDYLILPLIQIQSAADEYHRILRVDRDQPSSQTVLDRIVMRSRSFQSTIATIRSSLPSIASSSMTVQMAIHFATAYVFEQDLLSPFTGTSRLNNTTVQTDFTSSRIDILIDCLAGAVNYLDFFLTIPPSTYRLLGVTQWSGLTYSTLIAYRLSIGTPRVPSWDVQVARDTVKLENYLETITARVKNETLVRLKDSFSSQDRDFYSVMGLIWQNVRNTYERLRCLPPTESSEDKADVHATSFSGSEEIQDLPVPRTGPIFKQGKTRSGYKNSCPALQCWATPNYSSSDVDAIPEDPFLGMSNIDSGDEFWRQAFADMAKVGDKQNNGADLEIADLLNDRHLIESTQSLLD